MLAPLSLEGERVDESIYTQAKGRKIHITSTIFSFQRFKKILSVFLFRWNDLFS